MATYERNSPKRHSPYIWMRLYLGNIPKTLLPYSFALKQQYLMSERSEWVRHCSYHSNMKYIYSCHHVISSIYKQTFCSLLTFSLSCKAQKSAFNLNHQIRCVGLFFIVGLFLPMKAYLSWIFFSDVVFIFFPCW